MPKELTTKEAADALGLSTERVIQFIRDGRLTATKRGRDWLIDAKSVARLAQQDRPAHRPKKARL